MPRGSPDFSRGMTDLRALQEISENSRSFLQLIVNLASNTTSTFNNTVPAGEKWLLTAVYGRPIPSAARASQPWSMNVLRPSPSTRYAVLGGGPDVHQQIEFQQPHLLNAAEVLRLELTNNGAEGFDGAQGVKVIVF